jgi:uncharacterized phage protein (TIGR02218 family)
MTSFDTLEGSVERSQPIEVYRIEFGVQTFRYTSSQKAVTLGSEVFEPLVISRSSVSQSREREPLNLEVVLPGDNMFVRNYLNIAPGRRAFLTVLRLQANESPTFDTQVLLFRGTVSVVSFTEDGRNAKIVARSIEFARAQNIPRFTFSGVCNNLLYDEFCKVNSASFRELGTVSSGGTTTTLTIPEAANRADGFFDGGYINITNGLAPDFRMILSHTGDEVTILLPFSEDATGLEVAIFAGCDHTLNGDCALKFDNVANYGGSFFVPPKNIFSTGLS